MLGRRDFKVQEIASALPKEARAKFLSLEPEEQELLINGSDIEREQYGWLPPMAAKRFAKLDEAERVAEARAGQRLRRMEQRPMPGPVNGRAWTEADAQRNVEQWEAGGRVAQTARDIFEFPEAELERVQSMAFNFMRGGMTEEQALDRVAEVLIDDVAPPAVEAPPTRMQVRLGAGGFIRG